MHVIKMINIKKYPKNYKNLHKAQNIRHLKTQTDEFKPYRISHHHMLNAHIILKKVKGFSRIPLVGLFYFY